MKNIKALSYNIHKGFNFRNKKFVLTKMREAIRTVDPDIIFLQEVIGDHISNTHEIDDWKNTSQFEYLAHELWEHYAYGKNATYKEGHHGNAILSKFPIKLWENIDISTNPMEKRGALHTVIEIDNTTIHALCLHLNLLSSGRRKQINQVCERIEKNIPKDQPIIIAGDFNDWNKKVSETFEARLQIKEAYLYHHGEHAKTFPSYMPVLTLDRIYYRGIKLIDAIQLSGDPWKKLSDHIALISTFEI